MPLSLRLAHGGGADRVVLGPAFGHRGRVVQEVLADQRGVGHGAGKVGVILQRLADVDHRGEHPGELGSQSGVEALAADGESVQAEPDLAGGGAVLAVDRHEVPACGRELLHRAGHPHDVDAVVRPAFQHPGEPAAVYRRVVLDDDEHGRQHGGADVGAVRVQARPQCRGGLLGSRLALVDQVLEPREQRGAAGRAGGEVVAGERAVAGADVREPLQPGPAFL